MKKILLLVMTGVLILSSCSTKDVPQEMEMSSNNPIQSSSSEAVAPTENEPESAGTERENVYWDSENQFDPTLPENQEILWTWLHTEHKAFGPQEDFVGHEVEIECQCNTVPGGEAAGVLSLKLPPLCSIDEEGVIWFDGDFQNGLLKIGYISGPHKIQSNETVLNNSLRGMLWQEVRPPVQEYEANEIRFNRHYDISGPVRIVSGDLSENWRLVYMVPIEDGCVAMLLFVVEPEISLEDVATYDAIAKTVE